ncbi:unnamed protein product, partial [Hapterophycus canaliculatus]
GGLSPRQRLASRSQRVCWGRFRMGFQVRIALCDMGLWLAESFCSGLSKTLGVLSLLSPRFFSEPLGQHMGLYSRLLQYSCSLLSREKTDSVNLFDWETTWLLRSGSQEHQNLRHHA